MNFKEGDKYIHFTKYGGVNRGIVKKVSSITVSSIPQRCTYIVPTITTDSGVTLLLNGTDGDFYKIGSELSDEQITKMENFYSEMRKRKEDTFLMIRKKLIEKNIINNN